MHYSVFTWELTPRKNIANDQLERRSVYRVEITLYNRAVGLKNVINTPKVAK